MELNYNHSPTQKVILLQMNPKSAILWLIDQIFDYLEIEDLEKVACVCRLFMYTATMEKLYQKFDITESDSTIMNDAIVQDFIKAADNSGKACDESLFSVNTGYWNANMSRYPFLCLSEEL